jgi:hypothetical protein
MITDNAEYAKVWNTAIRKIITALKKEELQTAQQIFNYEFQWIFETWGWKETHICNFLLRG